MIGHLRVKSPWSQLGIFLGLFGAAFILASLVMAIVVMAMGLPITGMTKPDLSDPAMLSTMKLIQAFSSIFIFLLPAIGFALITFNGRPFYFLGLKPVQKRRMYALAVACIIVAFPFVFWLGEMNHLIPLPKWMVNLEKDANKQLQAFLKAEDTTDVIVNVLIIALLPAICEELCFRGALQRIAINLTKNAWLGIILTAIFFLPYTCSSRDFYRGCSSV